MQIEHIQNNGIGIAHITAQEPVITDTQSALDLAMSVKYETCASRIAISKDLVWGIFYSQFRRGRGDPPEIYQLPCENGNLRRLFPLHQQAPAGLHL